MSSKHEFVIIENTILAKPTDQNVVSLSIKNFILIINCNYRHDKNHNIILYYIVARGDDDD